MAGHFKLDFHNEDYTIGAKTCQKWIQGTKTDRII